VPRWRGLVSGTYQHGGLSIDLRARYIEGGLYNHTTDIANNKVASRTYVDFGFELEVGAANNGPFVFFGSISNLLDRDPPPLPNPAHFDIIGRYLTVGVRKSF
jgi:hypothetical protein